MYDGMGEMEGHSTLIYGWQHSKNRGVWSETLAPGGFDHHLCQPMHTNPASGVISDRQAGLTWPQIHGAWGGNT